MKMKEIDGFSGYFVDENGEVWCNLGKGNRRTGRTTTPYRIRPRPLPNGYLRVYLRRDSDNKRVDVYIHRLVAQNFIPNPENKKYVNHLNCRRDDNRVGNLEWVTAKENSDYTFSVDHVYRDGLGRFCSDFIYA